VRHHDRDFGIIGDDAAEAHTAPPAITPGLTISEIAKAPPKRSCAVRRSTAIQDI
jgi:hypothetical protein